MFRCHNCGILTGNPKFCSRSCSISCGNRKRVRSHDSRNRTSESVRNYYRKLPRTNHIDKCVICGTETTYSLRVGVRHRRSRITCGKKCLVRYFSELKTKWLSENWRKVRVTGQSWLEKTFEAWLSNNGCKKGLHGYLTEVWFWNDEIGKSGWIDFLFPTKRAIVELDGTQHKNTKQQDAIRDDYLSGRGYMTIRISHKDFMAKTKEKLVRKVLGSLISVER